MTAPVSPPQPSIEPYQHVCPDVDCCYHGQPSFRGCGCYRTRDQMMLARIEELKARAEQAEQSVYLLESNAREQAKLLADTGRRMEDLAAALQFYAALGSYESGDTYNHRSFTRPVMQDHGKIARAALPPSTPAVSR